MKWGGKGILEEIHDKAVSGSEYMTCVEEKINLQLDPLLSTYENQISDREYEKLREIVVGGVVVAEKEAFIAGVCYGAQLFMEVYGIETGYEVKKDRD